MSVSFTNLDEPLFPDAGVTKRDLIDYLTAVSGPLITDLRDRPLSVIRVLRGQTPFMQKNVPSYTPQWIRTISMWAETSKRDVSYALCNDERTLLWFGNQRAVEYHPALVRVDRRQHPLYLILDLDPPSADDFPAVVRATRLVERVLAEAQLSGAVKTSGSKGVHVFVPLADAGFEAVAAAARALAVRVERLDPSVATTAFMKEDRGGRVFIDSTRVGGATVACAYSPRVRAGATVSFPVRWQDLERVNPKDFTIKTAPALLSGRDPWAEQMPAPQRLSDELVAEGNAVPLARVQAMHEGKRRARARRSDSG